MAALAGALCIAFSGIFFRYALVEPSTGSVFRCLYALPFLGLLAILERRKYGPMRPIEIRLAIVAGLFFAADLTFWHHAIGAVGAGLATVLGNLQIVIVAIVAWLLLGERPSRMVVVALPFMLLGIVLISGVVGSGAYGADPTLGVILGVLTALSYAGYLMVTRHGNRDARRPASVLFFASASTAVVAAVVGTLLGEFDPIPTWPGHGWLFLLAFTSQVAGYLLISFSLPRLPAVMTSVILMVQPVTTVVLAAVLLGESPSGYQLAGVGLVIAGLLVANVTRGSATVDAQPDAEAAVETDVDAGVETDVEARPSVVATG
jgi:drug/metabolite transporter (DMT)-like permease